MKPCLIITFTKLQEYTNLTVYSDIHFLAVKKNINNTFYKEKINFWSFNPWNTCIVVTTMHKHDWNKNKLKSECLKKKQYLTFHINNLMKYWDTCTTNKQEIVLYSTAK